MIIKKFDRERDYDRIIQFLRDNYEENKSMVSWLPERFDDLIYRIDTMYSIERGKERNADYIYIFEDDSNNIIGVILPDGDSFNSCIKNGYEYIFSAMVDLGEKELKPLFEKNEDGSIRFLVVSHDSLTYQADELTKRGYIRDVAGDYDNVIHPLETNYVIELPEGYRHVFGEGFTDGAKSVACSYGFHPDTDNGDLNIEGPDGPLSYQSRKNSQFYNDSFESMIVTDSGDICSYCFCYVDRVTNTAFFEPVSTREKYRHKGFAIQMLHAAINRLKEMGIQNAYINSYDWRVNVYRSVGFKTEDSIGCWYKVIK